MMNNNLPPNPPNYEPLPQNNYHPSFYSPPPSAEYHPQNSAYYSQPTQEVQLHSLPSANPPPPYFYSPSEDNMSSPTMNINNDGEKFLGDENLVERLLQSDYEVTISRWFSEGWALFKTEWLAFILFFGAEIIASLIPNIGTFIALGIDLSLKIYGLNLIRRSQGGNVYNNNENTLLSGFYWIFPGLGLTFLSICAVFIGLILLVLPGLYLIFTLLFAMPLLLEFYDTHQISMYECMKVSVKVTGKHFCGMLLFQILILLFSLSGLILLGVGILITVPVSQLAVLVAFNDIFGLNPERHPDRHLVCCV